MLEEIFLWCSKVDYKSYLYAVYLLHIIPNFNIGQRLPKLPQSMIVTYIRVCITYKHIENI